MSVALGRVALVGAGPGDPELITVRGLARVRDCDVVVFDRLVAEELVAEAPAHALRVDRDRLAQEDVNRLLVAHALRGRRVVRLKGGDPFVFGRGGEEAAVLLEAGIPFEIVPGVSSVTAAAVSAGFPLTHRDFNHGFLVITGSKSAAFDAAEWTAARTLIKSGGTVVVFMGLVRIEAIVDNLMQNGCSPDTPVALVSRATWPTEETRTGTLCDIHKKSVGLSAPALLILGSVVALSHEKRKT
jgi:uroporphyrin-III C-methyltransferase